MKTLVQSLSALNESANQNWVDLLLGACDPDEKLDMLVKNTATLFDVPIAMVNLLTPDLVVFKACVGQVKGDCLDRDGSFCDVAVSQEPPLCIVDASKSKQFKNYELVTNELQIRSYFGKSLHAPDGTRIGTLCALDTKPRKYSKEDRVLLNHIATSVEKELQQIIQQLSIPDTVLFQSTITA